MAGIPYLKYQCLVLCRKRCIPRMEPRLPPKSAIIKREASEMRNAPRMALFLSMPIIIYPAMLIIIYTVNQAGDAENEEVGAEEADKINISEVAGVQDDGAKNHASDASKDPDKAVGWINGGAEADEEFEDAADDSVGSEQ